MNKKNYTKMRGAYMLMLILFVTHIFMGNSSAPSTTGYTGAPGENTCATCHGGNNPQGLDGTVSIIGLPAEVMPNTNYRVTVEVANPNGLSMRAGMQMVALDSNNSNAGTFSNPSTGAGLRMNSATGRNYLGHSPAQPYDSNGVSSFSVDWTSPADPDPSITFYAVGNITDMDPGTGTSNDFIVTDSRSTEVVGDVMMDLPDLTASNVVGFTGTYAPDEVAEFTWDLNNIGNAIAVNDYRVVMYLSDDQTLSADDPVVGEVPTGNTFPGTIAGVPGAIRIPVGQADGDYYLHFFVDNDDTVEESDEDNNIFTTSTTITVETFVPDPITITINQLYDCATPSLVLSANVSGGVMPYTYTWNTGETTETITVTENGTYIINVEDDAGQMQSLSIPVIAPVEIIATAQINQQPSCGDLGEVEILVEGGSQNFSYEWSNGNTGDTQFELVAGDYSVTIIDAETGCLEIVEFTLVENSDFDVTATVTQLTCSDDADASISLEVIGVDNATFAWSNGAETSEITGLSAGTYTVTISAGSDCTVERTYIITEINPIELITSTQNISCFGDSDGMINALATGGTGPYTYLWSNGETTNNIMLLSADAYEVTVTDAKGCTYSESFEITEPTQLSLESSVTNVTCFGGSDGRIDIVVTGGTLPYNYTWAGGASGSGLQNLVAGEYSITVTDANACMILLTAVVSQPEEIITTASVSTSEMDGTCIDFSVAGGVAPYTFEWSNGETTEDVCLLDPGTYTVTITDAQGCTISLDFEVVNTSVAGISEVRSFEVYPSLAQDEIQVAVSLDQPIALQIQIVSLDGRFVEVPHSRFSQIGLTQKSSVDISALEAGIYLLILESEQGREVSRFIKL